MLRVALLVTAGLAAARCEASDATVGQTRCVMWRSRSLLAPSTNPSLCRTISGQERRLRNVVQYPPQRPYLPWENERYLPQDWRYPVGHPYSQSRCSLWAKSDPPPRFTDGRNVAPHRGLTWQLQAEQQEAARQVDAELQGHLSNWAKKLKNEVHRVPDNLKKYLDGVTLQYGEDGARVDLNKGDWHGSFDSDGARVEYNDGNWHGSYNPREGLQLSFGMPFLQAQQEEAELANTWNSPSTAQPTWLHAEHEAAVQGRLKKWARKLKKEVKRVPKNLSKYLDGVMLQYGEGGASVDLNKGNWRGSYGPGGARIEYDDGRWHGSYGPDGAHVGYKQGDWYGSYGPNGAHIEDNNGKLRGSYNPLEGLQLNYGVPNLLAQQGEAELTQSFVNTPDVRMADSLPAPAQRFDFRMYGSSRR